MRIVIAYDKDGNIVNVARVLSLPEDMPHPFADFAEEHHILSIEKPTKEMQKIKLADIPHQYRVDTKTEKLRKK
jgi:hypothetical protein